MLDELAEVALYIFALNLQAHKRMGQSARLATGFLDQVYHAAHVIRAGGPIGGNPLFESTGDHGHSRQLRGEQLMQVLTEAAAFFVDQGDHLFRVLEPCWTLDKSQDHAVDGTVPRITRAQLGLPIDAPLMKGSLGRLVRIAYGSRVVKEIVTGQGGTETRQRLPDSR